MTTIELTEELVFSAYRHAVGMSPNPTYYEVVRDALAFAFAELAKQQPTEPEPARDLLSSLQRSRLDRARSLCVGNSTGEDALRDVIAIVDALAPKPAEPADPLEALLAEMRGARGRNCGYGETVLIHVDVYQWADKLEAALKAREAPP